MNTRLEQIYFYMVHHNVDLIVVTSPQNINYLTNFYSDPHERFMALVVSRNGAAYLLVPSLELENAKNSSTVVNIVSYDDSQNPLAMLQKEIPAGTNIIGFEKSHLTLSWFEKINTFISVNHYIDIEEWFREMRANKSPDEVSKIKHAVHVVENVLTEGMKRIKTGVTEVEVAAELEYLMRKQGAEGPTFNIVLSGENTALPHGKASMKKINPGEFLLIDLGICVNGYWADIARTFVIEDYSRQMETMFNIVRAANDAAINATRPGTTFASIDKAARDSIHVAGYSSYFVHRVGHGLGLEIHEYPSIHSENHDILSRGNVFTIEPGIYVPGVGGVRIEDNVLVTESGSEVLTRFSKELICIGC